jgi:prepilin-type N-terminal cleavage/methylation domain-containing protein
MRRGFSLLEMLLVLSILAVAAAVVWPSLANLYSDSQLRNGAEQVRTGLLHARLRAIERGVVYHFRYVPGDRLYQVSASDGSIAPGDAGAQAEEEPVFALSAGLRFFAEASEASAAGKQAAPPMSESSALPVAPVGDGASLANLEWSAPIVFRPDGTADDASLVVASADGGYVQLSVRSVTGVVNVSAVQRFQ